MSIKNKYQPLDLTKATVVITGGSSGIGLGLAEQFLKAGSTLIITGRREETLNEAKKNLTEKYKNGTVHTFVNDVGTPAGREKLVEHITTHFPHANVIVNNAGVQRRAPLPDKSQWSEIQSEIEINFGGPVHLTNLLLPHLLKQKEAAIVNVTSGLAFVSPVFAPVYGATKAALHNYTVSARYSLAKTNIRVVEIIPPAVKTNLGFGGDRGHGFGEDLTEFCEHVFKKFVEGEPEIGFKFSEDARYLTRDQIEPKVEWLINLLHVAPVEPLSQ